MTTDDEAEVRTSCYVWGWKDGAAGRAVDVDYANAGDVVVRTEYVAGYSAGRDALTEVRAEKALEYGRKA